ncbi:PREDICTED: leptin receptor gene-related protein-like [Papilio polytes]|uniref:leptin receptor gene-related protein-like n=1 Tax=Papilio polytes TaxID=76194 RepID=UPI00067624CE|nr:PREDICTED: leptin receptor gene-related protein-like [Papilio polytes]
MFYRLLTLAFTSSVGVTLVIIASALPQYKSWFPFLGLIFNLICPIPTIIARRRTDSVGGISSACMESAIFITMGIVVSSFAYPIVLARAGLIMWPASYLTLVGNVIVYLAIIGFYIVFEMEDTDYTMW